MRPAFFNKQLAIRSAQFAVAVVRRYCTLQAFGCAPLGILLYIVAINEKISYNKRKTERYIMPKYKAVVFDMDGTILYTLKDLQICINHLLNKYGYPERTIEEVRSFVGNGIKPLIERAFPADAEIDMNKLFPEMMDYYRVHCLDTTYPYEGIPEVMKSLREGGVKVAIVSNKPDLAVNKLSEIFFNGLYDIAVGEIAGLKKKPAPDEVFYALDKLGVDKNDAVYVGDSDIDMATAKNSQMDCISVSWGFKTRGFLESMNASPIIDKPEEILDIVLN